MSARRLRAIAASLVRFCELSIIYLFVLKQASWLCNACSGGEVKSRLLMAIRMLLPPQNEQQG